MNIRATVSCTHNCAATTATVPGNQCFSKLSLQKYFHFAAVLAAMAPELAPFMADEMLLSMPDVEGIDYTMKEYMRMVEKTKECVDRLNAQGEN